MLKLHASGYRALLCLTKVWSTVPSVNCQKDVINKLAGCHVILANNNNLLYLECTFLILKL